MKTSSIIEFNTESGFKLELTIENLIDENQQLDITYHLIDERGILVTVSSTFFAFASEPKFFNKGQIKIVTTFPGNILNEGIYTFSKILLVKNRGQVLTSWNDLLSFEILPSNSGIIGWQGQKEGVVKINDLPWEIS